MQGETLIAGPCLPLVFHQNWLFYVTFLLFCVITSHNSINIPKGVQVIGLVALNWKFRTIGVQCSCAIVLFVIHARGGGGVQPFILRFQMTPLLHRQPLDFHRKWLFHAIFFHFMGPKLLIIVCAFGISLALILCTKEALRHDFMFHLGLRALLSFAWIFMSYLIDVATC
jgi:hypothetical protein